MKERCEIQYMEPHKSGSPMRVVRELAKYKLDLVGVEKVRWDK
jgi:hypothetical protein